MTILEAIKSGKRFRRPCFATGQLSSYSPGWIKAEMHSAWYIHVSPVDILADDWEVEEKKVEITREQLERAIDRTFGVSPYPFKFRETLAKELGL